MVDFLKACAQRQHEDHGVEDRPSEQTVVAGGEANRFPEAFAGWEFLAIWSAEFDTGDEAALANFVDQWVAEFQSC
jgi:hypothetical protein